MFAALVLVACGDQPASIERQRVDLTTGDNATNAALVTTEEFEILWEQDKRRFIFNNRFLTLYAKESCTTSQCESWASYWVSKIPTMFGSARIREIIRVLS